MENMMEKSPYKMLRRQSNGFIVPLIKCEVPDQLNAARQTLPEALQQTGAIHGIRGPIAIKHNTVIGSLILAYEPKYQLVIDIDSLEDFAKAEHTSHLLSGEVVFGGCFNS